MAQRKKPGKPPKRHDADRYRSKQFIREKWSNAKSALIGFLIGRGYMTTEICEHLNDGTHAESIRSMIKKWGLPVKRHSPFVPVHITPATKRKIAEYSKVRDMEPGEYCRKILTAAVKDSDMYDAIVDEG